MERHNYCESSLNGCNLAYAHHRERITRSPKTLTEKATAAINFVADAKPEKSTDSPAAEVGSH